MTSMQVVGCTPPTAYMPNTIVQVPRPVTDYARYGNRCNKYRVDILQTLNSYSML